jgi:OFA family oxalate/formate antiporter-like MFS transporter
VQAKTSKSSLLVGPWQQLVLGIVCMACVANLQYGWTLFVAPIDAKFHWGRAAIQVAFSVFVFVETWLIPIEGYLVDRFGPRWVVMGGAVLVGGAWVLNSVADTLPMLYVGAAIGGIGTGCVYGTCVGNALKWFPGRRGLAAGFTAAGFGAGAALTVVPIGHMIEAAGFQHTFFTFGVLQGAIVLLMALGMVKAPEQAAGAVSRRHASRRGDCTPAQVVRTPVFWVMYAMFVLVAAGGLMMAASLAPIAKDFKIDKVPVELLYWTLPALSFALSLDRILDGVGRPFFGWVSDRIGRENTMFVAFGIGAVALYTLTRVGTDPMGFVIFTGLYFSVFGEIYSLFPATQGDTFGSKYAASNAGMLYTAKGTASFLVPLAAWLAGMHGWVAVFWVAIAFNVVAALLALLVLKPMRARWLAGGRAISAPAAVDPRGTEATVAGALEAQLPST